MSQDSHIKKSPFDDLNKDELIQKCKGLLAIAQKAKQAKAELQDEIENYKLQLDKCESEKKTSIENYQTLQELVNSLTEQKLNYITEVDSAQNHIKLLNGKCMKFEEEINKYKADLIVSNNYVTDIKKKVSDLDSEVISLKRQNKRLLDENEQLINQLTELEAQSAEFKNIGLQQREQLKSLEEIVQSDESYKSEIEKLNKTILELERNLESKEENLLSDKQTLDYENKIKDITELYEVEKNKKEKANIKLRSYKDKILKCAACINQLKNSRFILSKTVKEYSENIPKWQHDIIKASKILDDQISELNNENTVLKDKLQSLEKKHAELLMSQKALYINLQNSDVTKLKENNEELKSELIDLQQNLNMLLESKGKLEGELEKLKSDHKNLNEIQLQECINENKQLNDQLNRTTQKNQEITEKNTELLLLVENLKSELSTSYKKMDNCLESNNTLKCELENFKFDYQTLNDLLSSKINEIQILEENLHDIKSKFENNTKENKELCKLVENLKTENLKSIGQNHMEGNKAIETMSLQIKALESEKAILVKEKMTARDNVLELENQNGILSNQLDKMKSDILTLKSQVETLSQEKLTIVNNNKTEKESEFNNLKSQINLLQEQYDTLKKEHEDLQDLNGLLKEEVETLKLSLEQPTEDGENLSDLNVSLQADIVKLETKLAAYKQENASLLAEIKESRAKVKEADTLTAEFEDTKSKLLGYKTENTELLNEMKEINQVLKERGEAISKLQKAIAEMERLVETLEKDRDIMKNEKDELNIKLVNLQEALKNAELITDKNTEVTEQIVNERDNAMALLAEKEAIITSLKDEIEKIKQQQSSSDLPHEDMSTSTISRAEEHSRMKDLDETFEDKYTKLRIFALKLKKKLNETTTQLQNSEQDKARMERLLQENNSKHSKSASIEGTDEVDNSNGNQVMSQSDITNLQNKVKTLSATIEASHQVTSELEKLKVELDAKSKQLSAEIEAHKITKENLEKARRDAKKKNVLSLEMEDYERSMKELTAKMDENKKKMIQMESTIDTQEGTITSMKTQIKLLEEQIKTEETQNRLIKEELQHSIEQGQEKDNVIQIKNSIILKLENDLEDEKRKNEEADLEMTSLISEKEKYIMCLGEEKAELNSKVKKLEFICAELNENLRIMSIELADLKTEYTSYKVRAQAVLRQNQTVDHSQEEQLKEEAAALRTQIETLSAQLTTALSRCAEQTALTEAEARCAAEARAETARSAARATRLHAELTRLEHTLHTERDHHKTQVTTITQCYKTQIRELEAKLQKETEDLKKELIAAQENTKIGKASGFNQSSQEQYMLPVIQKEDNSDGEMDINVSMIPREEGEGSESAPSPPPSKYLTTAGSGRSPVSLERLLEEGVPDDEATDSASLALTAEQELADLKRRLQAQQQREKHMRLLLSDSERECARLSQLSDLLKGELRRLRAAPQQHNVEYMKNVTFKFLTLTPGDERCRLVPVLQKILTLTPDETQKIQAIAKGLDPNPGKGWGSYLPWPGGK